MKKVDCLVIKAMNRCKCDSCKSQRDFNEVILKSHIAMEVAKLVIQNIGQEKQQ